MAIGVAILVGIVVVALLLLVGVGTAGVTVSRGRGRLDPRDQQLRYAVPPGQDPAVLTAALRHDGYDPVVETVDGSPWLVVPCAAGRDRERAHVRAVIGAAGRTSLEGPSFDPGKVSFEDEDEVER